MKILLVNTFDRGGAANACLRLQEGLLNDGLDTNVLLKFKEKQNLKAFQLKQSKKNKYQRLKQYFIDIIKHLADVDVRIEHVSEYKTLHHNLLLKDSSKKLINIYMIFSINKIEL